MSESAKINLLALILSWVDFLVAMELHQLDAVWGSLFFHMTRAWVSFILKLFFLYLDDLPVIDTDSDLDEFKDVEKDSGHQISDCDSESLDKKSEPLSLKTTNVSNIWSDEFGQSSSAWISICTKHSYSHVLIALRHMKVINVGVMCFYEL